VYVIVDVSVTGKEVVVRLEEKVVYVTVQN